MLAKEQDIAENDIKSIIAIARKVRNGSDIALERAISDVIDGKDVCGKLDDQEHPCKCSY
jgi:hypothetical protein